MNWTDAQTQLLKRLWKEGKSASQIANNLGDVSRSAVIGKVHRLKLPSRGRAASAPRGQKKTKDLRGAKVEARAAAVTRNVTTSIVRQSPQSQVVCEPVAPSRPQSNVVPISRKLALIELSERTCKWPSDDQDARYFSFCGNNAEKKGPYCGYHAKVAFRPAPERRRSR